MDIKTFRKFGGCAVTFEIELLRINYPKFVILLSLTSAIPIIVRFWFYSFIYCT